MWEEGELKAGTQLAKEKNYSENISLNFDYGYRRQ